MVKRIILFTAFVLLTVVVYNCDDAGVVETNNDYQISGKVNGWSQGEKVLKALAVGNPPTNVFLADSTRIQADGSFTVKLKDPAENVKYVFTPPGDSTCINNVIVSPAGFKFTRLQLNVYNDSNIFVGRILRAFSYPPPVAGSVLVDYYYFDEPVSINGEMRCENPIDTNIARYTYSGIKGWNRAVIHYNSYTLTRRDFELNNTESVGVSWMFTP